MVRSLFRLLCLNHLRRRIPNTSHYIPRTTAVIECAVGTAFSPRRNLHETPTELRIASPPLVTSVGAIGEAGAEKVADDDDEPMNEFLSRFVWKMRKKIRETYPDIDRGTCDGMLLVIAQKVMSKMERSGGVLLGLSGSAVALAEDPSLDLSPHLWTTAWDMSWTVLEDMKKNRKRELMKRFLHSDDVKGMCRFASEVGIRGDMLREFRFKWALEEMEEWEFRQELRQVEDEARWSGSNDVKDGGSNITSLPARKSNIKYKIYGLDLSDQRWMKVVGRLEGAEQAALEETKPIMGQCRLVTEKIINMGENEDPSSLLDEWTDLMEPRRADWTALLHRIKYCNPHLYPKVAELLLDEESYQANLRDYSGLMDAYVEANRVDAAERIFEKMTEKAIKPDILTSIILVQMYSKAGNLDRAREEFDGLRKQGFQPDYKLYKSMIKAYLNAGQAKLGEQLMFEMENMDMKPPSDIYIELLQSFSQQGKADEAHRMVNRMQFAGIQQTLESTTLLIEAYGKAGQPDQARNSYDYMIKTGIKPDDRCVAGVLTAYAKKNHLDKALDFLLKLEKDGFKLGIATNTVLVDWFGRLLLVDEVEQLLEKITKKGDLAFDVHVGLCSMYSKAGIKDKALKSLQILLGKKELLNAVEFERIIDSLLAGGLTQEANSVYDIMKESGVDPSERIKVALMAQDAMSLQRPKSPR